LLKTLIQLICYIIQVGNTTCGDRFGTHSLENCIALLQRLSYGYDSLDIVNRNVAKMALVRDVVCQLNIAVRHHRREFWRFVICGR
jgi:hypothetical protein